jgi:hypothetical protein
MRIHLLRSQDLEREVLRNTYDLLLEESGPAHFIHESRPVSFRDDDEALSWEAIFGKCAEYRAEQRIPSDDFIILLTARSNELNWFSCPAPNGARSAFVHATGWGWVFY